MSMPTAHKVRTSDAELIGKSLTRPGEFVAIFDRHFTLISHFLRARVGADAGADLAAETFAVAFRRRGSYDLSRPDARPWLFGIAIKLVYKHRRRERRRFAAMMPRLPCSAPRAAATIYLLNTDRSAPVGVRRMLRSCQVDAGRMRSDSAPRTMESGSFKARALRHDR